MSGGEEYPVTCEWCRTEFILPFNEDDELPDEVNCPSCGSLLRVYGQDTLNPSVGYPNQKALEEKWGVEAVRGDVEDDEKVWWDRDPHEGMKK